VRTAVVVGAGVGGLAAAGGLARSGWYVTLLERRDRLRGASTAVLIWPNGAAALAALGLTLGDAAFPMTERGIRRSDGRWLIEAAAPASPSPVVVHGDDLHDALMAGLGETIEIRTATDVTTVRVSSGERPAVGTRKHTFEADLVVAADGGQSLIRRRLAPRSVVRSAGYTTWRAVIPWFRAPKLPETLPRAGEMLGAGQRFLHAALGERGTSGGSARGGIYWAATAPGAPRPESPATQLTLLRRWFAEWQSPVGELLEATEPDDLVQQASEDLRPLPPTFGFPSGTGGFVLLGDAAHVATPTLTQGACLAFEDAATLQALVRDAEPGHALTRAMGRYTVARRPRVERVARASRRLGRVMQAQGRLTVRARDAALGRLPSRLLDRASASSFDWTPPS
jgi:2-polyprenyl-6-methoxyphenol hydroxylase-like FAD-dependent oxidoreductase